jgi:hypothetical protein
MSNIVDLTGRWTGYYLQLGREHPITADLVQSGSRLSGAMCDGQPDSECSLFEIAQHSGLAPGADEQIAKHIREQHPDAKGPIRYVMRLPTSSILEGHCKGSIVYFLKSYQGNSYSGYKAGDQLLGTERPGHSVHYEGRLETDDVISGKWWIDANPAIGFMRTEGLFLLRRTS